MLATFSDMMDELLAHVRAANRRASNATAGMQGSVLKSARAIGESRALMARADAVLDADRKIWEGTRADRSGPAA